MWAGVSQVGLISCDTAFRREGICTADEVCISSKPLETRMFGDSVKFSITDDVALRSYVSDAVSCQCNDHRVSVSRGLGLVMCIVLYVQILGQ